MRDFQLKDNNAHKDGKMPKNNIKLAVHQQMSIVNLFAGTIENQIACIVRKMQPPINSLFQIFLNRKYFLEV